MKSQLQFIFKRGYTVMYVYIALMMPLLAQDFASAKANTISYQNQKPSEEKIQITIGSKSKTLDEIFNEIERSTHYRFNYNNEVLQNTNKIKLSEKFYGVEELLDLICDQTNLKYKIIGNLISVAKKQEKTKENFRQETPKENEEDDSIKGMVIDSRSGDPVIGANVLVQSSGAGTTTEADGSFAIEANIGDVLVISYVGYNTQQIKITNTQVITVKLEESSLILDEIAVVGTRGKARTDVERPVPVDVINARELQATGQTELGQMAQFTSPSFNSAKYGINGVANYADPATLRGMSPDQVLLLVDGKRRHQFSALNLNVTLGKGTVTTDLNSIPSLAIERLEILRDGAAAQYGSDAIAGIVNLGLNKSVGKGTFRSQIGQTSEGDGKTLMGSINYGFKLGKEGSYLNATLLYNNAGGTQRSDPFTGRIYTPTSQPIAREDSIRAARGKWPTSTSGTPFRVSTYGSNPMTAIQTFVNIGYPINKDWSLYAFGGTSTKEVRAEGFFRNAIPTDANSNIAIFPDGYDPDLPGTSKDVSGVIGLKKKSTSGWNMDFSTGYGQNLLDLWAKSTTNPSMGKDSPTEFYVGRSVFGQSTSEANISKSFNVSGVKSLNLALGTQFRVDFFEVSRGDENSYKIGPVAGKAIGSSGRPGISPDDETDATRSNLGLYLDVESDITDKFLVTTALRFENYSDFGTNISGKLATRYKLSESIGIRGSINKGFRAPSLQQIFNAVTTSTVQAGAIRQTKQLPSDDPRLKTIGIEDPKAETSWNYNLGLTAKVGEKLLLTVDAYKIDISDRIIISEALTTAAVPAVKNLLTGTPIQEIAFFTNHLGTRTSGIDFVSTFKHDFNAKNKFIASLALTLNKTEITDVKATPSQLTAGATNPSAILIIDTISRSLIETSQPRQKILLSLGYQWDKLNLTFRANHFGDVIAWEKPAGRPHRSQTFSAKTILDLVLSYSINKNINLTIGANNFTDVYPDKVFDTYASYFSGQTPYTRNANQFGFNGAYYYGTLTVNF